MREVAVVGAPHPRLGEEVVAFIVPDAAGDADCNNTFPEVLREWCRGRIAHYKVRLKRR